MPAPEGAGAETFVLGTELPGVEFLRYFLVSASPSASTFSVSPHLRQQEALAMRDEKSIARREFLVQAAIGTGLGTFGCTVGGSLSAGVILTVISIKILNAMLLGENYARSMGINVTTGRILLFISTSILAGTVTAFCGPIGFIGIAVPHIARLIWKTADHRILIPGVMVAGAIILLLSDMISQLPGSDRVLPINSVTALIVIPIVVWIVSRNRRFANLS